MPATLAKVQAMPATTTLVTDARSNDPEERGVIAHELWGDPAKLLPLGLLFQARGIHTRVEPEEYGSHLRIDEDVDRFRFHARERVTQLCEVAEENHFRYRGWWLYAGPHTDYVMQ